MSLAHLSIIEKDDLIKKMPKDALKRELREPSGNLPLFLIAARLKEVETMEKPKGYLNPDWVEQLMGLPIGWTALDY